MLSPDPVFSETGSVTGIKYCDRFKQYKKLIVKLLETPRMKALFTRFNAELFPVDRPDPQPSPSSTGGATEDEDDFARAFNDDDLQGMSASTSISYSNDPPRWKCDRGGHRTSPLLLPWRLLPLSSRPSFLLQHLHLSNRLPPSPTTILQRPHHSLTPTNHQPWLMVK
jgi:hypothetical protein